MARRLVTAPEVPLRQTVQIRVIYADTDKMGVVYHATYLRFLEHARVEFIRSLGFAYADMEGMGFGLPVIDLAVTYLVPAVYDDIISVHVGLAKLTPARVNFVYGSGSSPATGGTSPGPSRSCCSEPRPFTDAWTCTSDARRGCPITCMTCSRSPRRLPPPPANNLRSTAEIDS